MNWINLQHLLLPLDAPRLQSEAWFAARALETALSDALGNLQISIGSDRT